MRHLLWSTVWNAPDFVPCRRLSQDLVFSVTDTYSSR
jgi:hypothetical protein